MIRPAAHRLETRLRPASPSDLDLVYSHREAMFLEAGRSPELVDRMREAGRKWLATHLAAGRYFGFIAESDGLAVGGIGLLELEWPPHALHPTQTKRGYVLNVYVNREFRGRGVGVALMEAAEEEFRRRAVQYIVLHATDAGRPLYERMGWAATNEMSKQLSR